MSARQARPCSRVRPLTLDLEADGRPVLASRYRLDAILGAGGFAQVYRAVDLVAGRVVAVKLYRDPEMDAAHLARVAEEARLLAVLDHPGIPAFYDAGVAAGRSYLVTALVDGPNLADRLRRGPMTADQAGRIGVALAQTLSHVHARGVVHRDVKPSNVLLEVGGGVRLVDFGIARAADSPTVTVDGLLVGTAGYLAPEQIRGAPASPASDAYSLGLTLLEALTGRRTYHGTALEQAIAAVDRAPTVPAALGPGWCSLLSALTDPDPRHRPTMSDAARHLASWPGQPPEPANPWPRAAAGQRTRPQRERHRPRHGRRSALHSEQAAEAIRAIF